MAEGDDLDDDEYESIYGREMRWLRIKPRLDAILKNTERLIVSMRRYEDEDKDAHP